MASGFDISGSTSTANAANASGGPVASGGVSIGDVILTSPGSGLTFTPPGKGNDWTPLILAGLAVAVWLYLRRK